MLEGVVEHNKIQIGVDATHFLYALYTLLAYGGHHAVVLEFLIYLIGFVADVIDMALGRGGPVLRL